MNIGFDLDKVFVDYPPFVPDKIIDRLYKKKSNGILQYRIPSSPEQVIRKISHYPIFRPAIKENLRFLKGIDKKRHKLYLISSRFAFLKNHTENLVKRLGFNHIFDGIYFNYEDQQPHLFKDKTLHKLHLDMYVDDDFALLRHLAKHNKKTLFYWLNTSKRNQKLTRNILAINNISDILPHK